MKTSTIRASLCSIRSLLLAAAVLTAGCLSSEKAGDEGAPTTGGVNPGGAGTSGQTTGGSGGTAAGGTGGAAGTAGAGGKAAGGSGGKATGDGGPSSGTDGGAGSSGTGTDGGSASDGSVGPSAQPYVLDDLEDCNTALAHVDGRPEATWFQSIDSAMVGTTVTPMTITPAAPGSPGSPACGIHLSGMTGIDAATKKYGFAQVGFNFNMKTFYDASAFTGISFWAKGSGTTRFVVPSAPTTPIMSGGTCPMTMTCTDPHGVDIPLTADWTKYSITWDMLSQKMPLMTFDPKTMRGAQFKFSAGVTFDIAVDDVQFITGSGSPDAGSR